MEYAKRALELYEESHYEGIAMPSDFYEQVGLQYYNLKRYDLSIQYLSKAYELYKEQNYITNKLKNEYEKTIENSRRKLIDAYLETDDHEGLIQFYLDDLKYQQESNNI